MGDSVITHPQFRQLAIETIQNDDNRSDKLRGLNLAQKITGLINTLKEDKVYAQEYELFVKGMSYGNNHLPDFNQSVAQLENLIRVLI